MLATVSMAAMLPEISGLSPFSSSSACGRTPAKAVVAASEKEMATASSHTFLERAAALKEETFPMSDGMSALFATFLSKIAHKIVHASSAMAEIT